MFAGSMRLPSPIEHNTPVPTEYYTLFKILCVRLYNVNGKVLYTACRMLCSRLINTRGVCNVLWVGQGGAFRL